jgi:uncharacterized protein YkwD
MKRDWALVLLIPLLLSSGCLAPQSQPPVYTDNYVQKPQTDAAALAAQIHSLVNAERTKAGLSSLSWDPRLEAIAANHSADMVRRMYFGHVDPDGLDPNGRALAAGYNCTRLLNRTEVILPGGQTAIETTSAVGIGENLFKNNLYDYLEYQDNVPIYYDWNTQDQIARSTVSGWMNSTEHRENILNPHYEQEGIGIAISPDDGVYITENFC